MGGHAGRTRPGRVRVLVTGAGGQLGRELVAAFEAAGGRHDVVAATRRQLDVADRDQVLGAICTLAPDAVVHAAAWTAVDACEGDPDRALAVNALGTRWVADGARRVGAHVCYVSTDYVFDGRKGAPYHEWDDPNPQSVYGRSKLGGERELDPGSTVVRTSWVFGVHGANVVKAILALAEGDGALRFVHDQRGRPTEAADLAGMVVRLVTARLPGTFHVTNGGDTTWYELARDVLRLAGHDPGRVEPVATADLDPPRPAPRPPDSRLDGAALRLAGIDPLPDHRHALARVVTALTS